MRRVLFLFLLSAAAAIASCGGSGGPLAEQELRELVPASEDVSAFFGAGSDPYHEDGGQFLPNEVFAEGRHWSGETVAELESTGRITGYSMSFTDSDMPVRRSTRVNISLDLYRDDQSASIALTKFGNTYRTEPFYFDGPGDESIALPTNVARVRPDGGKGTCPCDFAFRSGPIVGFVNVSYPLPANFRDFDPVEQLIAAWISDRISALFPENNDA